MGDSTRHRTDEWANKFLGGLKRSAEMAEQLIGQNERQLSRIRQLEGELAEAAAKIRTLEAQLDAPLQELHVRSSDLIREQNCLTHAFVANDRLMRVDSVEGALETVAEILRNFAGVACYGLWIKWAGDSSPTLVLREPEEASERLKPLLPAVERVLVQERRDAGELQPECPLYVPIKFDDRHVGVLVIVELGPQVGEIGQLQLDLFELLSDRSAPSLYMGALRSRDRDKEVWDAIRANLLDRKGRSP